MHYWYSKMFTQFPHFYMDKMLVLSVHFHTMYPYTKHGFHRLLLLLILSKCLLFNQLQSNHIFSYGISIPPLSICISSLSWRFPWSHDGGNRFPNLATSIWTCTWTSLFALTTFWLALENIMCISTPLVQADCLHVHTSACLYLVIYASTI